MTHKNKGKFAEFAARHSTAYRSAPPKPKVKPEWKVGAKFKRVVAPGFEDHTRYFGQVFTVSRFAHTTPDNPLGMGPYAYEDSLWSEFRAVELINE